MLQIRLNNGFSTESNGTARPSQVETVTVACPDHLVIADLAVANGIGMATPGSSVRTVGRKSRRQLGERVRICIRCDFPIAIYGRLSPCEHVFCLDCARSDSVCHICDERIQKIQTVKLKEMIFICAAPQCLKSFMDRSDFESHIRDKHTDLIWPNGENEVGNEYEAQSAMQPVAMDSTARDSSRPVHTSGSSSQLHDHDDKSGKQQPRDQMPLQHLQPNPPPYFVQVQNYPSGIQAEPHQPQGFDRPGPHNRFSHQIDNMPSMQHLESDQVGVPMTFNENQLHPTQQTNPTPTSQYGAPSFQSNGTRQFYGTSYENLQQNPAVEIRSEQGSFSGFSSGLAGFPNHAASYRQVWNAGPHGVPFDYGKNLRPLLPNPPPLPLTSNGIEPMRREIPVGSRNDTVELAPQPAPPTPQPPSNMNR